MAGAALDLAGYFSRQRTVRCATRLAVFQRGWRRVKRDLRSKRHRFEGATGARDPQATIRGHDDGRGILRHPGTRELSDPRSCRSPCSGYILLAKETDQSAARCHTGLTRRTARRAERIAQDRRLKPRPGGGAPRTNHARLRLGSAKRTAAGRTAAVIVPSAIARPVARSATRHSSARDLPTSARTPLRRGTDYIRTVGVGATDLPGHPDRSKAEAARPRASSRDAISAGIAT
jgi:hypothetical protein